MKQVTFPIKSNIFNIDSASTTGQRNEDSKSNLIYCYLSICGMGGDKC